MSTDEPPATEDRFATWLAACADALAAGVCPPLLDEAELPPGARPQMEKALAGLRLLRQLRPRPAPEAMPSPSTPKVEIHSRPRSELPWTQLGRFELRRELGRGGFGMVFLAYDTLLRREVAVKVPRAETLVTPELRERFQQEARAAAALEHPNLVPVYEAGVVGPLCFLVSAYCPGPTLAAWLKQQTEPVSWRDAAALLATLADAVHYAHRHGVVHRDLKPGNILLQTAENCLPSEAGPSTNCNLSSAIPKITDFGLGKQITEPRAEGEPTLTPSGTILGTIAYMAPEQTVGRKGASGPAVDIHALGALLYELLTGRSPFAGESEVDTLLQLRTQEPIPPHRLRPRLPRDLETICLKCLQKDPGKRYLSAEALAEDLRRLLSGRAIQARPVGPVERLGRWCRRNPYLAAAYGLAAALFLAFGGLSLVFAFYQRHAALKIAKQFNLAERRSALLAIESGLTKCAHDTIPEGMLWLAHGLQIAAKLPPAEAGDLEWLARANLALWRKELLPLRAMLSDPKGIKAVAFSPDGRTILTGNMSGTIQRWDPVTGEPLGPPLRRHRDAVSSISFSADGRWFVTGSADRTAQVWDATTELAGGPPLLHPHWVNAVAFSPDGRTVLTGCQDGLARFWETASGKLMDLPLRHEAAVDAVAYSPDGRTVCTGSWDGTARFWEVDTRKPLGLPMLHQGPVRSVAYRPDGLAVVTGSEDMIARQWEAGTGKFLGSPLVHGAGVAVAVFSPDGGIILTGSFDRTARLWQAATGRPLGPPLAHTGSVNAAAYSPDGRTIVTAGWREPARLRELATERPLVPTLRHPDQVRAVAYSPDGRTVLTGCKDGIGRFWEAATGNLLCPTLRHEGRILAVAYSPDGRSVLTGSYDKTARLWDATTGKPIGPSLAHDLQVNAVAYSPDARTVLTGSGDRTARFWEAATGKPLGQPLLHQSTVETLTFSRDGRTIITSDGSGAVYFWEAATGKLLDLALQQQNGYFDLAYSPDGRTLLTGGRDMTARRWDAATRQPLGLPLRHQASIKSVAFSPEGRLVLTGSYDRTARLWDATTSKPLGPPLRHEGEVAAVAYSPDGRTVLTGSYDNTARFWPVPGPVDGEPERIRLWTQTITGMELDDQGVIHVLDASTWYQRRQRLNELGGPPVP
jgi:WD40 repeat protein